MSLGYGNFTTVVQYDIFAQVSKFLQASKGTWNKDSFLKSGFTLEFTFESSSILNSPNLSIFPLLAYHKICNDHYRNEKWQSFQPWTCNIDYLQPTDNMDAKSFIQPSTFTSMLTSILDLENSNLPIDYFTSVLPRAQYGDESAVPVGMNNSDAVLRIFNIADNKKGVIVNDSSFTNGDNLQLPNKAPVDTPRLS